MNASLTLTGTTDEIAEALHLIRGGGPSVYAADEQEAPAKPRRTRRTKAEIAADKKKKEAAPAEDSMDDLLGGPTEPITLDDLMSAVQGYAKENGLPAVKALFKEMGIAKLPELAEEQYAELHQKLTT